jgi:hypothetical protein
VWRIAGMILLGLIAIAALLLIFEYYNASKRIIETDPVWAE